MKFTTGEGGRFYGPSRLAHLGGPPAEQQPYSRLRNVEEAKRVWDLSQGLVKHWSHGDVG